MVKTLGVTYSLLCRTAVLGIAISLAGPSASRAGASAPLQDGGGCASLLALRLPGLAMVEAKANIATPATLALPSLPAHCEMIGELDRRTGVDGQNYAIRFHLRLPQVWNQRFFFQGGGGSNGVLGDALGNLQGGQTDVALAHGYAVVSQDSGHDNVINNRLDHGGTTSFGWDFEARRNYAYASQARVTEVSKEIIARFYGAPPRFSYFVGCSKGGQEGMAMAERFPDYFDGIMANAPGFALPRAAVAQAFDTQVFAKLTDGRTLDSSAQPLLGRSFSNDDLGLVSSVILETCDALDGLNDGIVGAVGQCTAERVRPALAKRICRAGSVQSCLTADQYAAMTTIMDGARTHEGKALYSPWLWDPGIGGTWGGKTYTGWREWKLGSENAPENDARNIWLGGSSLATVFTTPPTAVPNEPGALLRYQMNLDLAGAFGATERSNLTFPQSPWQMMAAQSSDRTAFRRAGGKMIVIHGAADPVFSAVDTIRWWEALNAREGGRGNAFVRLFVVPGMNHCRGGPGTTNFDAFRALTQWVEKDVAPTTIIATATPNTPWPSRTRPLCLYPTIARYRGHGDREKAASFVCTKPSVNAGIKWGHSSV